MREEEILSQLSAAGAERGTAIARRLASDAEKAGLLDVAYDTCESPIGTLLLAATPQGLLRLAFESEDHDAVLDGIAARISPRILRHPGRLEPYVAQLGEYFAGRRHSFEVPIDLSMSKGFRREVQARLCDIGYGHTETYAQVAARAGRPRAVRAVGSACATNPLPVVVPCHRVLRSDGSLGGYSGGLHIKNALLELEAG